MQAQVEFTVEPFVEGTPGDHVTAAVEAVRASGLEPVMEPFGTVVSGGRDEVIRAVAAALEAAARSGADRVSMQITFDGT
jgi:uncharacterized protein YqgV (UPF0045/DUF77 family)